MGGAMASGWGLESCRYKPWHFPATFEPRERVNSLQGLVRIG